MSKISNIINSYLKGNINHKYTLKKLSELDITEYDINEINLAKAQVFLSEGDYIKAKNIALEILPNYIYQDKIYSFLYLVSVFSNDKNGMAKYGDYKFKYNFNEEKMIKRAYYVGKVDYKTAITNLFKINEKENVDISVAELLYEGGNYISAKKILSGMINQGKNDKKIYYLAFKTNVMLGNFDIAFINLKKLSLLDKDNTSFLNIIYAFLNDQNITFNEVSYYGVNSKNRDLFNSIVDDFKKRNFLACYNKIDLLGEFKYIDVRPLKVLVGEAKKKNVKENPEKAYVDLYKYYETKDLASMYNILNDLSAGIISKTSIVYKCLLLLLKDGNYDVKHIFDAIPDFKFDKMERNIIATGINCREKLNKDHEAYVQETILKCDYLCKKGCYMEAYDLYTGVYYVTNNPILLYYCGQMLFNTRNYEQARIFFEQYLEEGYTKIHLANFYLYKIYTTYKMELPNIDKSFSKKGIMYLTNTRELNDLYDTVDIGFFKTKRIKEKLGFNNSEFIK